MSGQPLAIITIRFGTKCFNIPGTNCWKRPKFFSVNFLRRLLGPCLCCGPISAGSLGSQQTRILELLFQMVERCRHLDCLYVSAVLHSVAECMGVLRTVEAKKICLCRGWHHLRQRHSDGFFPLSSRFPSEFSVRSFAAVALQNAERRPQVSRRLFAPLRCVCYWGGQDILLLCCFANQTRRIERQSRLQAFSSLWQVSITKDIEFNWITVSTEQN